MIYYYQKDPPFSLGVPPNLLGSLCPPPEERCLSMPEIGEKERIIYLKVIQTYSNDLMSSIEY